MDWKTWICTGMMAGAVVVLADSAAADPAEWEQGVRYRMDVSLDAESKHVEATQSIDYHNASPDTLDRLVIHLYPNAFSDEESPMRRDHWMGWNGRLMDGPSEDRGWLRVDSLSVDGVPARHEVDYTLLRVDLETPLAPGDSCVVDLQWKSLVRPNSTRSGWRGKQFDMAQWYPKMAVYDAEGWDEDAYRRGEFYANFGDFRVSLDLPADHVVAATGVVVDGDPGWELGRARYRDEEVAEVEEGRRQVTFEAEDVHDFAWCSSSAFALVDTAWNGIDVHSFVRVGDGEAWRDSVHVYGVRALEWLDGLVGPYPYPQLSLVHGILGGGMEYPMLVMDGRPSESLVVHEVGHIYFYGILANDETGHAWLDEGFTTWQTRRYMRERYGPLGKEDDLSFYDRLVPRETLDGRARRRDASLYRRGRIEPIDTHSHDFVQSYGAMVYGRASMFLDFLEELLGVETFDAAMREYYERWKLRHVSEERFRVVLEEVSGMDLRDVFDQWLRGTDAVDFGFVDVDVAQGENGLWRSRLAVERIGDLTAPFEVAVVERDSVTTVQLVGNGRVITTEVLTANRPDSYVIDPGEHLPDVDRRNNRWPQRVLFGLDWPAVRESQEADYSVRVRPSGWYNDIDGLRIGGTARGGYGGWFDQLWAGAWYGAESGVVDGAVRIEMPSGRFSRFGRHGRIVSGAGRLEGLDRYSWRLDRWGREDPRRPPTHRFGLGFVREDPVDLDRLTGWDDGANHMLEVTYGVSPRVYPVDFSADFKMVRGFELLDSEHDYYRMSGVASATASPDGWPVGIGLRFFAGGMSETAPLQEGFRLGGAGPRAIRGAPWLASPGGMVDGVETRLRGDGDLPGYAGRDDAVQSIWSLGLDVDRSFGLPGLGRLLSGARLHGFAHAAGPSGDGSEHLPGEIADAGVAVSGRLFGQWRARVDMPLWVSHPELLGETESIGWRWVVELQVPWSGSLVPN